MRSKLRLASLAFPDEEEAHRHVTVSAPTRLRRDPSVVDRLLLHLCKPPPCGQRGLYVFRGQVYVGLDRDRLTARRIEVGGHSSCHNEEWMESHQDQCRTRASQTRRLAIQR